MCSILSSASLHLAFSSLSSLLLFVKTNHAEAAKKLSDETAERSLQADALIEQLSKEKEDITSDLERKTKKLERVTDEVIQAIASIPRVRSGTISRSPYAVQMNFDRNRSHAAAAI